MIATLRESSWAAPHDPGDALRVRCATLADLDAVLAEVHAEAPYLAVALGDGLTSAAEAHRLVRDLLARQAGVTPPLLLSTDRGSIGQDPVLVAELVAAHPDLRLAVDFQAWCFGSELLLADRPAWKALLRAIAPRVGSLRPPTAGPERCVPDRGLPAFVVRQLMRHRYRWLRRECARGPGAVFEVTAS